MRGFRDKVVVITGASSGIGRATALAFARQRATLVLTARRGHALEALAETCERLGGRAVFFPADVAEEGEVFELADRALDAFGRIDVWVNNAAVSLFSRFEEAPAEDFRRVFDVNFFGYVHGARVAMPLFRKQGHGVLINNASIFGRMGAPYLSAYVSTKFAILGLTECLRQEVLDVRNVHVCAVLPASIDTPIFHNAANYTGWAVKPLRPIYRPEQVARAIVRLARRPARQRVVGSAGRWQGLLRTVAPATTERKVAQQVRQNHFVDRQAPRSSGNLYEPRPGWTEASGAWRLAGGAPRILPVVALTAGALGAIWVQRRMTPRMRHAFSLGLKVAAARSLFVVGRGLMPLLRTGPGRALVMVAGPAVARRAGPVLGRRAGRRLEEEVRRFV